MGSTSRSARPSSTVDVDEDVDAHPRRDLDVGQHEARGAVAADLEGKVVVAEIEGGVGLGFLDTGEKQH